MLNIPENFNEYPSFTEALRQNSKKFGGKPAVNILVDDNETTFTYSDLVSESQITALFLSKKVKAGDRVILAMSTSPEFIRYFFGCLWLGAIPVPLPVEKSNGRFSRAKSVVEDCKPSLVIVKNDSDYQKMRDGFSDTPVFICDENLKPDQPAAPFLPTTNPNQVALIQYTSGSTSDPKGVVITHANLMANIKMIQQGMQVTENELVVSWLPLHHDMGLVGMLLSFVASGATTTIYPYQEFSRNPLSWLDLISRKRATLTGAPTFAFDIVEKRLRNRTDNSYDLKNLRLLYCGSERISIPAIQKFYRQLENSRLDSKTFFPCYGLAEATLYISGGFADPFTQKLELDQFPTCGHTAKELSVEIKQGGKSLPNGIEGEIFASGLSISHGYWKDLKDKIENGILSVNTIANLATGDLGILREGQLFFTGRKKDIIKIRGMNHYPDDIETPIEGLEEFFSPNSVVALPLSSKQDEDGITIIAEINRSARDQDFSNILGLVQTRISGLGIQCRRFVIVSPFTLPKTSSGKKRRQVTQKMLDEKSLKVIYDSAFEILRTNQIDEMMLRLKKYVIDINMTLADERRTFPADFISRMTDMKLMGLLIPKEFGGAELTHSEFSQIGEKLGELDVSLSSLIGNHNTIGVLPILKSDILKDREQILVQIAQKGKVAAFALTEPEAGSNPRAITTKLVHQGQKMFLSGEKVWIGNASLSEYISVFAKEYDEQGSEIGISAFLIQKDRHSYVVGEEQLTIGLKPMPQSRLIFNNVEVSEADRLSKPGEGLKLAFEVMEYARFGLAAASIGALKTGLHIVRNFTENRRIWTGLLSENPFIQSSINEMQFKMDVLKSLVKKCSEIYDSGDELPVQLSLSCKILAGEWGFFGLDQCLQFCGGRGYTETFGIGRLWRDQRIVRIFEGPTEVVAYQLGALILRSPEFLKFTRTNKSQDLSKIGINVLNSLNKEFTNQAPEILNINTGKLAATLIALLYFSESDNKISESDLRALIEYEALSSLQKIRQQLKFVTNKKTDAIKYDGKFQENLSRTFFDIWPAKNEVFNSQIRISAVQEPVQAPAYKLQQISDSDHSALDSIQNKLGNWLLKHVRSVSQVDFNRPITDYGVDSLLAYELLYFIEEEVGVLLPEMTLVTGPSINMLAKEIETLKKGDPT